MTYRKHFFLSLIPLGIAGAPAVAFGQAPPAPTPPPAATDPTPSLEPQAEPPAGAPEAPTSAVTPPPPASAAPPSPATEAPAPPADAPPQMYIQTPAPEPIGAKTRHYHDGFYLRLALGTGLLWAKTTVETDILDGNSTYSGGGFAFELSLGGTPAPGLVVGGGFLLQDAFDPGIDVHVSDGTDTDGVLRTDGDRLALFMIGPIIDVFPDPDGGLHVGGMLGLAALNFPDKEDNPAAGGGLSAWAGYAWWVSSQFSLGATVRLTGAFTGRDLAGGDSSEAVRAAALSLSAFYH